MEKGYVRLYNDFPEVTEALDDAEVGRLVRAIFDYKNERTPALTGNERFLFPVFRAQIDRDKESYLSQCKRNAENGKLGGRPKTEQNPKNPVGFPESEKSQDKDKDKEKEKEKDYNPPKPPKGSDDFELFWASYPKKVGKQAAKKAFDKVKVPVKSLLDAIEQQKRGAQWSRDNGQYIPNPATWLNQGRWEDEVAEMPTKTTSAPHKNGPGSFDPNSDERQKRMQKDMEWLRKFSESGGLDG